MGEVPDEEPPEPPEPPGTANGVTETVGKAATTVRDYVSQRRSDSSPGPDSLEEGERSPSADPSGSTDPRTTPSAESTDTARTSQPADSPETPSKEDPLDDHEVTTEPKSAEDRAQASARGEVADETDLLEGSGGEAPVDTDSDTQSDRAAPPREDAKVVKKPDSPDRPDLEELRQELNDQFESIKILEPGQYELNLMGLYDREEHIIALQEDGKYMIEVPETWRDEEPAPSDS